MTEVVKPRFYKEMTVGEAMAVHPEAGLVFQATI